MAKFFSSDHHFDHANVIKYCNRPFKTVDEMNQVLIARWNTVVQPTDEVYYLGDFSLNINPVKFILPQLNGIKYLIPGNHDQCHPRHKKHNKYKIFYEKSGFTVYHSQESIKLKENLVVDLCHIPHTNEDLRYPEYKAVRKHKWLLCGHVHEKWKVLDNQINVGVDQWNFYPVSMEQILEIISR